MPEVTYNIVLVTHTFRGESEQYWEVLCFKDGVCLPPMNPRVTFGTRDEALNYVKEKNNGN